MSLNRFNLTTDEKKTLLRLARDTIASHFRKDTRTDIELTPSLRKLCGAFVTLHEKEKLRGCIGYIQAQKPLFETIKEAALASAFQDYRFSPVCEEEVERLEIEISVLSPFRRIGDIQEIEVGRHGVMIRRGNSSGLLLPQVATEYSWSRETLLLNTCLKAGLPSDAWRGNDVIIEVFSALVFNEGQFHE
jgi:AmmeMemoRadiSam system protein A